MDYFRLKILKRPWIAPCTGKDRYKRYYWNSSRNWNMDWYNRYRLYFRPYIIYWKTPCCWERLSAGEGATEDKMVVWHHWLKGHEFEQNQGDSEGHGSLVCCSPWGREESDTNTEWLSNKLGNIISGFKTCFEMINTNIIRGWKWKRKLLSRIWLFATPWIIQSMEFSRPEY